MRTYKGGRFPNIHRWMSENKVSARDLARRMDVPYDTVCTMLRGQNYPGMHTIRAVLRATGMTFEEAFREEEP